MNPKQHAKRNTVLRVIAFLLIVALVYGALTRLLTINNATEQQYIRSFYLEPKNSLDVMILGASETFTDYCAPLAWQHAGFTSYPLAVSAAQGTLYASMLRESAKRQNPSVYVVEVNGFLYTEAERDELGTAATREWLDTLRLSRNKVQAISPAPGEKFDPHFHQAISMVPSDQEPNTIVTVLQKGYLIAERVLRPALVMVAQEKS